MCSLGVDDSRDSIRKRSFKMLDVFIEGCTDWERDGQCELLMEVRKLGVHFNPRLKPSSGLWEGGASKLSSTLSPG